MINIEKVRLFTNDNNKSQEVEKRLRKLLKDNKFTITENDDYNLAIAIGGDGAFLRMINDSSFRQDVLYVGINAGTLGFAQDIGIDEISSFIKQIKKGEFYYDKIGIQDIEIDYSDGKANIECLNEIVLREKDLNTFHADIFIDDELLEKYAGDGLLIATSFGSTAYNLSFGGSIVYNDFDTLQITPIAPLKNSSYNNLTNSVIIPSSKVITIYPKDKTSNIIITVDGRNAMFKGVEKIEIRISNHIKMIRRNDYNYTRKIHDKFLK